jgi:hypothetical protein
LSPEWRISDQHLIHDDAQAPPVTRGGVAGLEKHFWGDVVWKRTGWLYWRFKVDFLYFLELSVANALKMFTVVIEDVTQ